MWFTAAWLWVGGLQITRQFGVKFEEGAYQRVSVHITGVDQPENCVNFLAKFEASFFSSKFPLRLVSRQRVSWGGDFFRVNGLWTYYGVT